MGEHTGVLTERPPSLADYYELTDKDLFAKTVPFSKFIAELRQRGEFAYRRTLTCPNQNRVTVQDPLTGTVHELVMMASNNYLGLTNHPKVVEAGLKAMREFGVGAGSVPLLGGTQVIHRRLEERLAQFKDCEDAVVFSSGYGSNIGCLMALLRRGDTAINDRLNHASIIDGCRMSGAQVRAFRHNDMANLAQILVQCDAEPGGKLVIVDGVFSMDGDIAPLPAILELARRYGAKVMIDEAHATGVLGATGRGTPEHFGLEGQIDIVAGTLSKALGAVGGFVASTREVVEYIRFYGRSYMFSTNTAPAVAAALIAALDVIEGEPWLRQALWDNIRYTTAALRGLGFDLGRTETAIIPVLVADDAKVLRMNKRMHEEGVFLNPVAFPAVPKRKARLRLSLMATHTRDDLDRTIEALAKVGREFGVIS